MPVLTWSTGKLRPRVATIREQPYAGDAGFTLIELIIVMSLIAIVSLTAVPAWQQFNRTMTLRGAALQFASLLRYTQLQAVGQAEERTVTANFDAGTYRLQPVPAAEESVDSSDGTDAVSGAVSSERSATNSWEVTRTLPTGVSFNLVEGDTETVESGIDSSEESTEDVPVASSTSKELAFYPDGSATPAIIELSNATKTYQITVNRATGTVKVTVVAAESAEQ